MIENVEVGDDGVYICRATNDAGTDSGKLTLSVLVVPVIFKKQWPRVAPVEGENIVLECQAKGVPKPEVSWYLDDMPIRNDKKFNVEQVCHNK